MPQPLVPNELRKRPHNEIHHHPGNQDGCWYGENPGAPDNQGRLAGDQTGVPVADPDMPSVHEGTVNSMRAEGK